MTFNLVFTCPRLIRDIYYQIYTYYTPEQYAAFVLTANIGGKLGVTNTAANFFLYCLSGKKFRADLKRLVTCQKKDDKSAAVYRSRSRSTFSSAAT